MNMRSNISWVSSILLGALLGVACGPSQPEPATAGTQPPAAAVGSEDPMPEDKAIEEQQQQQQQQEGTHTMPDGTTMEGHTHGDHGSGE
jgi:hypothetical protein